MGPASKTGRSAVKRNPSDQESETAHRSSSASGSRHSRRSLAPPIVYLQSDSDDDFDSYSSRHSRNMVSSSRSSSRRSSRQPSVPPSRASATKPTRSVSSRSKLRHSVSALALDDSNDSDQHDDDDDDDDDEARRPRPSKKPKPSSSRPSAKKSDPPASKSTQKRDPDDWSEPEALKAFRRQLLASQASNGKLSSSSSKGKARAVEKHVISNDESRAHSRRIRKPQAASSSSSSSSDKSEADSDIDFFVRPSSSRRSKPARHSNRQTVTRRNNDLNVFVVDDDDQEEDDDDDDDDDIDLDEHPRRSRRSVATRRATAQTAPQARRRRASSSDFESSWNRPKRSSRAHTTRKANIEPEQSDGDWSEEKFQLEDDDDDDEENDQLVSDDDVGIQSDWASSRTQTRKPSRRASTRARQARRSSRRSTTVLSAEPVLPELPPPSFAEPSLETAPEIQEIEPDAELKELYPHPVDHDFPVTPPSDAEKGATEGGRRAVHSSRVDVASDSEFNVSEDDVVDYHQPQLAMDRHTEVCRKCGDHPSRHYWKGVLIAESRYRTRAKKNPKLQSPAKKTHSGRTSYTTGMFEDGVVMDTPEQRLQEWKSLLQERAGWFQCSLCTVSFHWGCLSVPFRDAIVNHINCERASHHRWAVNDGTPGPKPIERIEMDEVLDSFACPDCVSARWTCMVCLADTKGKRVPEGDGGPTGQEVAQAPSPPARIDSPRLFRCMRCFRCSHYECLIKDSYDQTTEEKASAIQANNWLCPDCQKWPAIDQILAWRPLDRSTWDESKRVAYPAHSVKENLKREYLVKFQDKSYRETVWVPHNWLSIVAQALLRFFLRYGARVELEPAEVVESARSLTKAAKRRAAVLALGSAGVPALDAADEEEAVKPRKPSDEVGEANMGPPMPEPDAKGRIPRPWRTPDRILSVKFFASLESFDDDPSGKEVDTEQVSRAELLHPINFEESWMHVSRMLVKWQDVGYERSTWEKLPSRRTDSDIYADYQRAYKAFLASRQVSVPLLDAEAQQARADRHRKPFRVLNDQPSSLRGGALLDFQLDGVNWLRYGWHHHQPGILADEMGLGKTVQIIAFLGSLWTEYKAGPFLIVVPNSTLPNWVREFEKWLPHLRVVPYWGEVETRRTIDKYELFHAKTSKLRRSVKAHVVIASDVAVRGDSLPLRKVGKWDVMIVDEGQNLKSGHSLLLRKLNEMETDHRLIMTGTPLNNNIGELFNLLNWLEPRGQWRDIKALNRKYEVLTKELIDELQPKLKPYFLRRLKSEVLDLPPKTELIVPTSLRPIQKRIYRSILEHNIADIQALTAERTEQKSKKKARLTNLNNILMQLRKCIQHPYLIAPDLEAKEGEADYEASWEHQRLVDASAKLLLLQRLLPKLKERGHRVLLFSQFVINLDIVEVFLSGENYKYLRLDGNLGQKQRQKGIDAFNAPGSDYFIYMISTRAGGVGINLATADTVIIFDPDFNPHVDMQAIARAHRIGQTKKVLVFTLMCKATAEEQIIESAKRKLLLDHLIIQNLNNEDDRPGSLESMLKFGAQALFAEGGLEENERDVRYTDEDLDALLDRGEKDDGAEATGEGSGKFSYARVWEKDPGTADAADGNEAVQVDDDFWADLLEKHSQAAALKARQDEIESRESRRRLRDANLRAAAEADAEHETPQKRPRGRPRGSGKGKGKEKEKEKANGPGGGRIDVDNDYVATNTDGSESGDGLESAVPESISDLVPKEPEKPVRKRGRPSKKSWVDQAQQAANLSSLAGNELGSGASSTAMASQGPSLITAAPAGMDTFDPSMDPADIPDSLIASFMDVLSRLSRQDMEDIDRRYNEAEPEVLPRIGNRNQLTMTHVEYFAKGLSVPIPLFLATFTIVPEEAIPEGIRRLPYGGAVAMNLQLIVELLRRTATFMLYAVRLRMKRKRAEREAAALAASMMPPPVAHTILDAKRILSEPELTAAWADRVKQLRVPNISVLVDQVLSFPEHEQKARLLFELERSIAGKDQAQASATPVPSTGPAPTVASSAAAAAASLSSTLGAATGAGSNGSVTNGDAMGGPSGAYGNEDEDVVFVSQRTPDKRAPLSSVPALLRRSAAHPLAPGSPAKARVDRFDLIRMAAAPKPARKARHSDAPSASASAAGAMASNGSSSMPNSPAQSQPVPSSMPPSMQAAPPSSYLTGLGQAQAPRLNGQGGLSGAESTDANGRRYVAPPPQLCMLCHGEFHFVNRCPVMQNVHAASLRWNEIVSLPWLGSQERTMLRVVTHKLNGMRAQEGMERLEVPDHLQL